MFGGIAADDPLALLARALEPDRQRGALLCRNLAILLCMRYAGALRSEIATIRIDDVDRQVHKLELQTKGHRKGDVEYLPVVLYQEVAAQLWTYFSDYQPVVPTTSDHGQLFLSHGARDYGRPITDSGIREIFDRLRPALSSQWRKKAAPHTLRQACAYELQRRVSLRPRSAHDCVVCSARQALRTRAREWSACGLFRERLYVAN